MKSNLGNLTIHYEEIGSGKPVVLIHGFSLDHRMMVGCMEPVFAGHSGWRRLYVDLPGMGKTRGADWIQGSDDMLRAMLDWIDAVIPDERFLLVGESYGGYLARGILLKKRDDVAGMALICPMIEPDPEKRVLPGHTVITADDAFLSQLKDESVDEFKGLAVVQDEAHWKRFRNEILSAADIADDAFLKRIKQQYAFSFNPDVHPQPFEKPVLIVTGRQDSRTGYQDAWAILENYPRGTFAVLDRAGHDLQMEQQQLFEALMREWLDRVSECTGG